ncbi:hypothetical protein PR048_019271 [Dryococelus australis]|uniref:Uncharacterized protein n=1 Tax=Dryococelus australis TaxID=614101 RepID=A0ABQ9H311_9NEOP|nr:hypothetical protein PR048_019271 [Dryococelus australis]
MTKEISSFAMTHKPNLARDWTRTSTIRPPSHIVDSRRGRNRGFTIWESCRTGFLVYLRSPPLHPLQSCAAPHSARFTLIGAQELAVKRTMYLRVQGKVWSSAVLKGKKRRGVREIAEKTRRPTGTAEPVSPHLPLFLPHFPNPFGVAVAARLVCTPPTKADWQGHSRIFACGNRAGRCCLSAGFLEDLPFPQPFHSGADPYSPQSPSPAFKTLLLRAASGGITCEVELQRGFRKGGCKTVDALHPVYHSKSRLIGGGGGMLVLRTWAGEDDIDLFREATSSPLPGKPRALSGDASAPARPLHELTSQPAASPSPPSTTLLVSPWQPQGRGGPPRPGQSDTPPPTRRDNPLTAGTLRARRETKKGGGWGVTLHAPINRTKIRTTHPLPNPLLIKPGSTLLAHHTPHPPLCLHGHTPPAKPFTPDSRKHARAGGEIFRSSYAPGRRGHCYIGATDTRHAQTSLTRSVADEFLSSSVAVESAHFTVNDLYLTRRLGIDALVCTIPCVKYHTCNISTIVKTARVQVEMA